ncbi:MAG: alpha/beta hydrolase fold domain-containing protein, partial [Gemmatimonadota bacterium]
HGGALIMGHREWVDGRLLGQLLDAGYAVVSIDYRLAPETRLAVLIEDIEDAYDWVRREGPGLFGADPSRMAVMGSSAGGYLTLTAGFRCRPRPAALVSFFGYGDLIGPWYSEPSPHACHHQATMSEDEARALARGPAVADDRQRRGHGHAFYQRCRQLGAWPQAVSGWDPRAQAEAFHPYMPVVNVDAGYPPTLLVHGTADTDVPYAQSVLMAQALRQAGVAHELVTVEGGEHGLGGGPQEQIDTAYQRAFDFIDHHLSRGNDDA